MTLLFGTPAAFHVSENGFYNPIMFAQFCITKLTQLNTILINDCYTFERIVIRFKMAFYPIITFFS